MVSRSTTLPEKSPIVNVLPVFTSTICTPNQDGMVGAATTGMGSKNVGLAPPAGARIALQPLSAGRQASNAAKAQTMDVRDGTVVGPRSVLAVDRMMKLARSGPEGQVCRQSAGRRNAKPRPYGLSGDPLEIRPSSANRPKQRLRLGNYMRLRASADRFVAAAAATPITAMSSKIGAMGAPPDPLP
jgi:hypothetical protein